jgi:hypothetical protein
MLQTQYLEIEPSQEENNRRLNRFVRHCNHLGIPNPYSLADIYNADERWQRLHPNAVPPLVEFYNKNPKDPLRIPRNLAAIMNITPPARLPGDYTNNQHPDGPTMLLKLIITHDLTTNLRAAASKNDTNLFVTLLAVINSWIAIISNQFSFSIGTVFPGETLPVPFSINLSGNPDFLQTLSLTQAAALKAYEIYPVNKKQLENVMFPILFSAYNSAHLSLHSQENGNFEDQWLPLDYEIENELRIEMLEENDRILFFIRFNPHIYLRETIEHYFNRFKTLLENFLESPHVHLSQLQDLDTEMLSEIF